MRAAAIQFCRRRHTALEPSSGHIFYTDHASGRGNLIYRRYDGGLSHITP